MIFSIIIPVYNGADYLELAIESVINQRNIDRDCFEIIVVNDGSTDGGKTSDIAKRYLGDVRYFEKENGGVSTALNFGIEHSRGDYICWLSHDDIFLPYKLFIQLYFIRTVGNDKSFVFFSQQNYIDSKGMLIKGEECKAGNFEKKYEIVEGLSMAENLFTRKAKLAGCTVIIPRVLFTSGTLKYFDVDLKYIQDLVMWVQISVKNISFVIDNNVVVSSRIHSGQQTGIYLERYANESRVFCNDFIRENQDFLYLINSKSLLSCFVSHYGRFFGFKSFYKNILPKVRSDFYLSVKLLNCFSFGYFHERALSIYRLLINYIHRRK